MSTPEYQAPSPPYRGNGPARKKTNPVAIAAFVSSFIISVTGVVLGHIALHQIKTTGEGGRGLAIAALVIGYVSMTILAIITISLFSTDGRNG